MSFVNPAPSWLRAEGLWSTLGEPWTAAALADLGPAWLALDQQHGRWEDRTTGAALCLVRAPVLVRVRSLDPALIGRALDHGAAGVIAPLVQSVEHAHALARAAHYPPRGERSWGPVRAGYDGLRATPVCAAMIETAAALTEAAAIAAVPGIDALFVGPFDLALALGTDVESLIDDGAVLRAIADAARESGIVAGAFAGTADRTARLRALGYEFLAAATEAELLRRGAAAR
ncbi:MAG: aldolase/citrate lyase family protein [Microbacteriaceae bacterium]